MAGGPSTQRQQQQQQPGPGPFVPNILTPVRDFPFSRREIVATNNCVQRQVEIEHLCVCVFYPRIQGKLVGGQSHGQFPELRWAVKSYTQERPKRGLGLSHTPFHLGNMTPEVCPQRYVSLAVSLSHTLSPNTQLRPRKPRHTIPRILRGCYRPPVHMTQGSQQNQQEQAGWLPGVTGPFRGHQAPRTPQERNEVPLGRRALVGTVLI